MTHTYNITGMTCGGCVAKAKSALLRLPGVAGAEVQLAAPQANITMQQYLPLAALQEALSPVGSYIISESESALPVVVAADTSANSYYPIFLIFGYILVVSLLIQYARGSFSPMQWMSHFMGGFFLVFSFFKLINLKGFAEGYRSYDVVARLVPAYGFVYPFIELALGLAFITGFYPLLINAATLAVMTVSTIGVAQSLIRKTPFQCACLGTVIKLPLSKVTLFEDALMITMSAVMLACLLK